MHSSCCPVLVLSLSSIPSSLTWSAVPLVLGAVAVLCAVLVLPRGPAQAVLEPDSAAAAARRRGQYLQHLTRILRAIRAVNAVIVNERNRQQLLDRACETLAQARGYRMVWIGLLEGAGARVVPVSQAGVTDGYLEEVRITGDDSPTGRGPTGTAIRTGEPCVVHDIETDPDYEPWRRQALQRGYRSSAALPLRFRGRVLGTLSVYADAPEAFDIQEVGLLQELADHIAHALGSIILENELEEAHRRRQLSAAADAAFEHAPCAMISTSPDGVIRALNRRAAQVLGLPDGGRGVVDRAHVQELASLGQGQAGEAVGRLFAEHEAVAFICTVAAPDGAEKVLWCRGTPIADGGEFAGSVWFLTEAPPDGPAPEG